MTPYAWSLLAIYLLQVNASSEGSLLPPLKDFAASSGLLSNGQSPKRTAQHAGIPFPTIPVKTVGSDNAISVGALFREFAHFYHSLFDWRSEAVSVRIGARAAPDLALPLHIVMHEDGRSSEVGPSVEDPFDASRNLCGHMTADSLKRLHEELARADALCTQQVSLTKLLEPWCPPEFEVRDLKTKEDADQASTRAPSACDSPPRSLPPTPPRVSPHASPRSPMAQGSTPAKSIGGASTPPWRKR